MTRPLFTVRMLWLPYGALALALVACDKPQAPAAAASAARLGLEPSAAPAREFSCDVPAFRRQWPSFDALRDEVGAANVTLGESEEGIQEVSLYPADARRSIELRFGPRGPDEPVTLSDAVVSAQESAWALPGGLKMGSTLDAVEQFNGRPIKLVFTGRGAVTADWQEGQLSDFAKKGCEYFIVFKASQVGSLPVTSTVISNDPVIRALGLTIERFGLTRYTP